MLLYLCDKEVSPALDNIVILLGKIMILFFMTTAVFMCLKDKSKTKYYWYTAQEIEKLKQENRRTKRLVEMIEKDKTINLIDAGGRTRPGVYADLVFMQGQYKIYVGGNIDAYKNDGLFYDIPFQLKENDKYRAGDLVNYIKTQFNFYDYDIEYEIESDKIIDVK